MLIAKGNRVEIHTLEPSHVSEMRHWGKHDNPLFDDYNFPELTDKEVIQWYQFKTQKRSRRCFSISNEKDEVIGYLSMKDIKRVRKKATLGIVFNPSSIGLGYGTEALRIFLNYYFSQLHMKSMNLHVAKYNIRGIRCYEKCGFEKVKEYKKELGDQSIKIFEDEGFKTIQKYFIKNKGLVYSYFYEMKLNKEGWNISTDA